jgi:coatomer subunit gamma
MLPSVEHFLKAAIVDKAPSISSAVMVSSCRLFSAGKDVINRWVNEVNAPPTVNTYLTSFSSNTFSYGNTTCRSNISQYHALGLLYLIRQPDRMAVYSNWREAEEVAMEEEVC